MIGMQAHVNIYERNEKKRRLIIMERKKVYIGPVLVLLLLALVILVGLDHSGAWLVGLLVNGVIGVIILMLLNYLPQVEVPINIWTFLIAALGGILGVVLLVLLNLAGVKEW
jgi:inhibitor of the pro-sigma K processing machinery